MVAGGLNSSSTEILDLNMLTWRSGSPLNGPLHGAGSVSYNEFMIVLGGEDGDGTLTNEILEYQADTDVWTTRIETLPQGRARGRALLVDTGLAQCTEVV